MKIQKISVMVFAALFVSGCSTTSDLSSQPCTSEWYNKVEQQVTTGDGHGHGPDPGSSEWRSVIEFRLGIRGNPDVPELNSSDWCRYINQKITR